MKLRQSLHPQMKEVKQTICCAWLLRASSALLKYCVNCKRHPKGLWKKFLFLFLAFLFSLLVFVFIFVFLFFCFHFWKQNIPSMVAQQLKFTSYSILFFLFSLSSNLFNFDSKTIVVFFYICYHRIGFCLHFLTT